MQDNLKSQTAEIKQTDVIRLILQFLQENDLTESFAKLQSESKISLNICSKELIENIIMESKWENLFKQLNYLTLSQETLFDLYELITDDLIDKDAFLAAKFIISRCIYGGGNMVQENKEKVLRLEYIVENSGQKAMYHKPPTHARRENIINRVLRETYQEVEKGRLLTLISSALRYEASKGVIMPNLGYSLLQGKSVNSANESEQLITKPDKILKYSPESRITVIKFSTSGNRIAIGGIDGLIELYEPIEYTLDTSLKYQADGIMLFHEHSISHIIFNDSDELISSVDCKGGVKIWNMLSGRLLRKIEYGGSVGCCVWGIDASQILVGHQNIQLYGIRSSSVLKEYVGNDGMGGNNVEYLLEIGILDGVEGSRVFSFSQGGYVRAFNYKTQEQVGQLQIGRGGDMELVKIVRGREGVNVFHICTSVYVLTIDYNLQQISKYEVTGSGDGLNLINILFTSNNVYECVKKMDGGYVIQIRDRGNKRIVFSKGIEHAWGLMEMHRYRNLMVVYGSDDVLGFWRP